MRLENMAARHHVSLELSGEKVEFEGVYRFWTRWSGICVKMRLSTISQADMSMSGWEVR